MKWRCSLTHLDSLGFPKAGVIFVIQMNFKGKCPGVGACVCPVTVHSCTAEGEQSGAMAQKVQVNQLPFQVPSYVPQGQNRCHCF